MDTQLRINFNITVLDMPCEFATIDVVDVLGTRTKNLTQNVNKWEMDEDGVRRGYAGRNRAQAAIQHDTHHPDLKTLHANGVHAIHIDQSNYDGECILPQQQHCTVVYFIAPHCIRFLTLPPPHLLLDFLKEHHYTFVNFYAPWCIWCQRLEPIWEAFAEEVEREKMPVSIVKVDCVANRDLCMKNRVQAFPMLRLFKDGEAQPPDYRQDRTVNALSTYLKSKIASDTHVAQLPVEKQEEHKANEKSKEAHPGCMLSGFLLVNRVPGHFHVEARSDHHNLNPVMSNLSHVVNHLSFGAPLLKNELKRVAAIPEAYLSPTASQPMDDKAYVNTGLHQAFHHFLKVVSTTIEFGATHTKRSARDVVTYQMVEASQLMHFGEDDIPDARFSYDISPMAVGIVRKTRRWYDFLTSVCALIGGAFTVMGIFSGFLGTIFKSKQM
jgi:thiol-disulfide isomerase/thioredoxin